MGYSELSIVLSEGESGYTYDPADAYSVGIYPDATVTHYDPDEVWFGGTREFSIIDAPYGSHSKIYAQYTATAGVPFNLDTAFGDASQPGRYLYFGYMYGENNSIPIVSKYSSVGEPTSPTLDVTIGRDTAQLSWGAGSEGMSNSVTGYDVQYQDSTDGVTWASDVNSTVGWTTVSGSPVTEIKVSASPPTTVGYYRRFRVRTRGSAGSDYYSGWVASTNTLRRKWNAFSAWTDATLTARTSMIRAVHLTEMQARVNTIRTFYGLAAYSFTAVTERSSKLARWAELIREIRTAIDGITTSHESWNTLEAGKPRIANVTQIRSIIDSM